MSALADSPSTIFQTLAETMLDIAQCDSAGLSLLTRDGKRPDVCGKRFYWPAIAGMWNPHVGGGTPRNFGPCGDVLDQNRTLLFRHFERRYPYLMPVIPAAEECLLVPFYVAGQAVGTVWAIMHSDRRKFHAEDDRVMASLAKFSSSAYQALAHIEDLKFQVTVLLGGALFKDSGNEGVGCVVDLSEQKRAQEALRRSEAYLTEAQLLSQTGSFGCRLSTGEMFWSEETFRIYGYDQSTQPSVERVLQRVHPEDKPLVQEQIDRASRGGTGCHVECRLLLPDDSVKHVRIVAHASKNESGIIEFIGAVMDVSATKQAEGKIRRSEAYLAEAQKLSHTGSFGWDVSSGEIYLSRETFRIFEYEPTAKVTIELIMQRTHPEDRSAVQQLIERVSRQRKEWDFGHPFLMADGSVKYLRVVAHPSRAEKPGGWLFIGAVTDITEAKRAEDDLQDALGQ